MSPSSYVARVFWFRWIGFSVLSRALTRFSGVTHVPFGFVPHLRSFIRVYAPFADLVFFAGNIKPFAFSLLASCSACSIPSRIRSLILPHDTARFTLSLQSFSVYLSHSALEVPACFVTGPLHDPGMYIYLGAIYTPSVSRSSKWPWCSAGSPFESRLDLALKGPLNGSSFG